MIKREWERERGESEKRKREKKNREIVLPFGLIILTKTIFVLFVLNYFSSNYIS